MSELDLITQHFQQSIDTKLWSMASLPDAIARAAALCNSALDAGHTIFTCGNGGSASDAQHFTSELINRFSLERDSLPSVALIMDAATLTSIANDYAYECIFEKPLRALGKSGDLLLIFTTSGVSPSILKAAKTAHEKNMSIVALTGKTGGPLAHILRESDCEIRVPAEDTARIQETHLLVLHCLCDLIDQHWQAHHSK